jgi:hypothetical protein
VRGRLQGFAATDAATLSTRVGGRWGERVGEPSVRLVRTRRTAACSAVSTVTTAAAAVVTASADCSREAAESPA